jgi:CheY-like chemotaxis protein
LFIPQIGPLAVIDVKTNKNVLVVEDDHINNLVLCKYLLKLGFLNIISKRNGKDAFDTLQESVENDKRFDYVFLDNKMPLLTGIEVSEKFLESKTIEKIILVSGEEKTELEKYGIDDIILKPYTIKEITKIIK